jgi:hypothetical protein
VNDPLCNNVFLKINLVPLPSSSSMESSVSIKNDENDRSRYRDPPHTAPVKQIPLFAQATAVRKNFTGVAHASPTEGRTRTRTNLAEMASFTLYATSPPSFATRRVHPSSRRSKRQYRAVSGTRAAAADGDDAPPAAAQVKAGEASTADVDTSAVENAVRTVSVPSNMKGAWPSPRYSY